MKLEKITTTRDRFKVDSRYEVDFDDGFTGSISVFVHREFGHTLYRRYQARFSEGDKGLGRTEIYDTYKCPPRESTNTIHRKHLEMVITHLAAIQNDPEVKGNSAHGEPLRDLTEAVSVLDKFYQDENLDTAVVKREVSEH